MFRKNLEVSTPLGNEFVLRANHDLEERLPC